MATPRVGHLFALLSPVVGQVAVVWSYSSGSTARDVVQGVGIDSSQAVVLGGYTEGDVHGNTLAGTRDWVAVKLDQDGTLQWTYQAGEAGSSSEVFGLAIDASSNVVLVGQHQGNLFGAGIGDLDLAVVMLSSAGVLQWSIQQGSTSQDVATCVVVDSSNDIVVGGYTAGTISGETFQGGTFDAVVLKLNNAGVQQWLMATELGTSGADAIYGITTDESDHIFVIGEMGAAFDSNSYYGSIDAFILKTDGAGTFVWSYQTGSTADDTGTGIGIFNGDVYGAGNTRGSLPGNTNVGTQSDGFIVKLNAAGVQQWLLQIGTATDSKEFVNGFTVSPLGHLAICGDSSGDFDGNTNQGWNDWWAAGYDTDAALQWSYSFGSGAGGEAFYAGSYDANGDLILAGRALSMFYGNPKVGENDLIAAKFRPPSSTSTSQSTTSTSVTSTTATSSRTTATSSTTSSATSTRTSTTTSSTSTSSTSTSTSPTSTSASATRSSTSTTTSSASTSSTSTATLTANATTAATELRLTRAEIAALETQRQEAAAATVAKVETAEDTAVAEVLAQLQNSTEVVAVTVVTDLGPLKVAALPVAALEAAGGTAKVDAEGINASVEVSVATMEEILLAQGLSREDPLLLSVLAMNAVGRAALETDGVSGKASTLVSEPLSLNIWRGDGSRIEVTALENPILFSLEVTDPDAKCAFWDEDTGKWSTDGVTAIASSNDTIECSASHLTIFAGIKDVFLTNIVLAVTCSTVSSLLSGPAFAKLQHTAWLFSTPSILNVVFHVVGAVCVLMAWRYDRKQERAIPWEEREVFLMQVKDEEVEAKHEDGDAPPPSRWTRCMGCCEHSMEYVSHATGGDATVEALKELAGNADTAAVNRAISTLQSHKARVARAQIAIFNKLQMKEAVEIRRSQESHRQPSGRSVTTASDVAMANTADHGQTAAETFLQRGWLCRVATLWPASHPWLKAMHFSMLAPVRASAALLVLKITSAGALGAVFFSSTSSTPDSDPECKPPKEAFATVVQSLTVGLITALLSDVLVYILFAMQVKKVVFSRSQWTERKKSRQRFRWNMRTFVFWLIVFLYGGFCDLYICLFLANVTERDRAEWLQSMGVALLNDLVLKSFLAAFILATIATLVLCCRPQVVQKIHAKWMKDGKDDEAQDETASTQSQEEIQEFGEANEAGEVDEMVSVNLGTSDFELQTQNVHMDASSESDPLQQVPV